MQNANGSNTFRGTAEDWNALGTQQVKQSVDSIAVAVPGARNNQANMH